MVTNYAALSNDTTIRPEPRHSQLQMEDSDEKKIQQASDDGELHCFPCL